MIFVKATLLQNVTMDADLGGVGANLKTQLDPPQIPYISCSNKATSHEIPYSYMYIYIYIEFFFNWMKSPVTHLVGGLEHVLFSIYWE